MALPNSSAFAKRLHEAGLIADPKYMTYIEIHADSRSPVTIRTESVLDDGSVETLVRELKALTE